MFSFDFLDFNTLNKQIQTLINVEKASGCPDSLAKVRQIEVMLDDFLKLKQANQDPQFRPALSERDMVLRLTGLMLFIHKHLKYQPNNHLFKNIYEAVGLTATFDGVHSYGEISFVVTRFLQLNVTSKNYQQALTDISQQLIDVKRALIQIKSEERQLAVKGEKIKQPYQEKAVKALHERWRSLEKNAANISGFKAMVAEERMQLRLIMDALSAYALHQTKAESDRLQRYREQRFDRYDQVIAVPIDEIERLSLKEFNPSNEERFSHLRPAGERVLGTVKQKSLSELKRKASKPLTVAPVEKVTQQGVSAVTEEAAVNVAPAAIPAAVEAVVVTSSTEDAAVVSGASSSSVSAEVATTAPTTWFGYFSGLLFASSKKAVPAEAAPASSPSPAAKS